MGYMMRAVVLVAQLGLLRAFSSSFSKENVGFELLRGAVSKVQEQDHQQYRRLSELTSEGSLGFSTTTVLTFCAYSAEVTDSDIREAVLNYWNTASNSIKVSVVDTTSGGDTDACSETHAYLSGDESAMFNGTQYTVEIVNGPPPVGSQYDTSADEASAQIEYFLQEDPGRVLMHLCETASIHAECGLASLGFLVTWDDILSTGTNDSATGAAAAEEQGIGDAINSMNQKGIYWPWWGWLIYAVVMVLCFAPMFLYVWRRRREFEMKESKLVGSSPRKLPVQEGLNKIYSPQWGMTEVDFNDGDAQHLPNNSMAMEMGAMGREYEYARQSIQAVQGRETTHDISNLAWGQVQRTQIVNGSVTTGGGAFDIDEIILDDFHTTELTDEL